jgi:guanylate kinase
MSVHGNLYVISSPSGGGKTSLVRHLTSTLPGLAASVSHTTREKRPGETDGVHYHFVNETVFRKMIEDGKFIEYATIFGHLYGTSREEVEAKLAGGTDIILEIDWQGAESIRSLFPDSVSIFIAPPSPQILETRLKNRNQDCLATIEERLADAWETMTHLPDYDYIVLNHDFAIAANELAAIIITGRLACKRQLEALGPLLTEFTKN